MRGRPGGSPSKRYRRASAFSLGLAALGWGAFAQAATATLTLPPISVGAGVRTSFTSTDIDIEDSDEVNDFEVNSVRLYLSGSATEYIKLTFNTEYNGSPRTGPDFDNRNEVEVLDAIVRFEFSPMVNFWMGRFLPPSDRANLYGPYYANHWGTFLDGVQDGYPFVAVGRSNGAAYFGDFGKLKFSAGFFDVPSTMFNPDADADPNGSDLIFAARAQANFWDAEPGYYLNGTYYGDKDILALGVATQSLSGDSAVTVDFLLEKKLGNAGVVSLEAEYADYDGLGGYGFYGATESDGYYVLGAYLFPQVVGIGKFQVLAKFGTVTSDTGAGEFDTDTTEVDLGYIMKQFNARAYLFYIDRDFEEGPGAVDSEQIGLGIQVQI